MPSETSITIQDGVTTEHVVTTNSDGLITQEVTTVRRPVKFTHASGADIVSEVTKTIERASMCNQRVLSETTVERAFCPTYTQGSEKVEEASAVNGALRVIRREVMTNKWSGNGFYRLFARETMRVRQDEPVVTPDSSGSNFFWTYPDPVPEQVFERWTPAPGTNMWRYTRYEGIISDRSVRFAADLTMAGVYKVARVLTTSQDSSTPPDTADCVIVAEPDDEETLGPDPCFDPFQDVPCSEAVSRTTQERLEQYRTLSDGRGVPLNSVDFATQSVTSPLLTIHYPGEVNRIVTLAQAAAQEAEKVLAGPSATLTESQPYIETVEWTSDVAGISLTVGEAQGITVERRIYGSGPVTS